MAGASFNVAGVMNVNSPACFQLASNRTVAGAGTFNIGAGSTFKYGGTITPTASGASGNVQTTTRSFPTTASYGFVGGTTPQTVGSGLPAQMVNMYLDKTAVTNTVTLAQNTTVTGTLQFYNGVLNTTSSFSIAIPTTGAVSGASATTGWVNGNLRRFVANTTAPSLGFDIGDASNYTPATVAFTGTTTGSGPR